MINREKYDNVVKASMKQKITQAPFWNEATIRSVAGVEFKSFAKSRRFQKELYEDWVAPILQSDLYVETWQHGTGLMPSNCTRTQR